MSHRSRFPAAVAAAVLSALACVATLIDPEWFEFLIDASSETGDGWLETMVALVVPLVACVLFASLARREWRRGRPELSAGDAAKEGS
jgi:hypothetical protein